MAARNADSMTSAQGEFNPHKPRSEPLTTSGHQVGQKVGNDAVPEFSVQTLPAGTAPKENTFQPNPVAETPGQADNPDAGRSHGKEYTQTDALHTLGGATSADVHTGLGHPGSGQTSSETQHGGQHQRKKDGSGIEGTVTQDGGLFDSGSAAQRDLEADKTEKGPSTGHNVSLDGAEDMEPVHAEELAVESENQ